MAGATGSTGTWDSVEDGPEEMLWTEEIHVDDLELIKKEWWLLGYWVKEEHPGYFEVFKEAEDPIYRPISVAGYSKPWNSKTWRLYYPKHPIDLDQSNG